MKGNSEKYLFAFLPLRENKLKNFSEQNVFNCNLWALFCERFPWHRASPTNNEIENEMKKKTALIRTWMKGKYCRPRRTTTNNIHNNPPPGEKCAQDVQEYMEQVRLCFHKLPD
jgi:hypothetical protein